MTQEYLCSVCLSLVPAEKIHHATYEYDGEARGPGFPGDYEMNVCACAQCVSDIQAIATTKDGRPRFGKLLFTPSMVSFLHIGYMQLEKDPVAFAIGEITAAFRDKTRSGN